MKLTIEQIRATLNWIQEHQESRLNKFQDYGDYREWNDYFNELNARREEAEEEALLQHKYNQLKNIGKML